MIHEPPPRVEAPVAAEPIAAKPIAAKEDDPLWYKDAVIYQLHIKSFFDANNDGVGDFEGLIAKLDYIAGLGVTAVWLLPFYPSPRRDDGYDIAGYCEVHPDYGTLEEAQRFIDAAHARGLKVITELVINHTSDQHPWFQAARNAPPGSPERDFYVWSDDDKKWPETRIIFLDAETSNWTWDPVAGAYFWHRFYSHQPDLNFDNPKVLEEVLSVMRFWLEAGVDGLRLDAIPYLVERDGTNNENLPETHVILKKIRAELDRNFKNRLLLAEANQWPEDTQDYFGDGDECHMAFHFPLMPRMYMAIAQEDRFPITDIMRQTPDIPESCQWAIFLRNHDELTLEMVTDKERDYLWSTYAADKRARINLGIRRRLAPLMERDRRRIELMNSLLFTMPGTPVIYYGDEIGMGDNIHLGDRDGVRTPMQWSPDRNGGFSRADPAALTLPAIQDPLYGFSAINVEAQSRDPHSLLNWLKRMLAVRGQRHAFGRGTQRFLRPQNRKVLAYLRELPGEAPILCVANVSRTAQAVELDLSEFAGFTPVELSGNTPFPTIGQLTYLLTLPPYGFYWFQLCEQADGPGWSTASAGIEPEHYTFVLRGGVEDVLGPRNRLMLEREVLPPYLPQRRWFQGKDAAFRSAAVTVATPLPTRDAVLAEIEVTTEAGTEAYALPLAIVWEDQAAGPFAHQLTMARVRRGRMVGRLTDGFATPGFVQGVLATLRNNARVPTEDGELRFEAVGAFPLGEAPEIDWLSAEQSNSSVVINRQVVLKLLRRIVPGVHPEAEMSRHLTLHGFDATPPLLGEVVRVGADGERRTLMLAQGFVHNQGDGWSWSLDYLKRGIDDLAAAEVAEAGALDGYARFAETFGRRVAQMHAILAQRSDDPAFTPETAGEADVAAWAERVTTGLKSALDLLPTRLKDDPALEALAGDLLSRREALLQYVRILASKGAGARRTRIHGDLHLGQILVAGPDVAIIDFEGEPARPLAERRAKDSPLRDVAGALRSFDYAAAMAPRAGPGETEGAQARTGEFLARFRQTAADAFLRGYAEDGGETGPLLNLFLIEKAAYELAYEAANRPAWLRVPLQGLAALAERLLDATDERRP
jgi:maltose alpha-D-glucosyltransferase/alpha-amylase